MAHQIIHPDGWAPATGYANGVLTKAGILYVGGQRGWDAPKTFPSDVLFVQMATALCHIRAVGGAACGAPEDITRLTWYVTDKRDYVNNQRQVGEAYREILGRHFPAMTMVVVSALVEDEAVVEIEATAVLSSRDER